MSVTAAALVFHLTVALLAFAAGVALGRARRAAGGPEITPPSPRAARLLRGGYESGPAPVTELRPPPRGPGIGARLSPTHPVLPRPPLYDWAGDPGAAEVLR